jgi:hypothetical protein
VTRRIADIDQGADASQSDVIVDAALKCRMTCTSIHVMVASSLCRDVIEFDAIKVDAHPIAPSGNQYAFSRHGFCVTGVDPLARIEIFVYWL